MELLQHLLVPLLVGRQPSDRTAEVHTKSCPANVEVIGRNLAEEDSSNEAWFALLDVRCRQREVHTLCKHRKLALILDAEGSFKGSSATCHGVAVVKMPRMGERPSDKVVGGPEFQTCFDPNLFKQSDPQVAQRLNGLFSCTIGCMLIGLTRL